jgi:IS5 family transposase
LAVSSDCARSALEEMSTLIDRLAIDRHFDGIYVSARGEAGWPPLGLFKARLLTTWHDLSDGKLQEALADRASLPRFCGFSAGELTPERTALVQFHAELVQRGLDR